MRGEITEHFLWNSVYIQLWWLGGSNVCNGRFGQLPLARLKIVVPVCVVDKVLRNEDVELLLV